MFQSKLFRKMLLTYLLIVFSYMILCIFFLIYENKEISDIQTERRSEIQLDEVSSILE